MQYLGLLRRVLSGARRVGVFPAPSAALRKQALIEIGRRATSGIYIYLACWLGITVSTGLILTQSRLVLGLSLGWLVLATARFFLHRHFPALVGFNERLARALFLSLLFCGGAYLGLITTFSLYWPPLEPALIPLMLVTSVLCASATLAMSIDPIVRVGMPAVMFLPFTLALLLEPGSGNLLLVVLLGVFMIYLYVSSTNLHQDYWDAIQAKSLLQEQAAEFERLSLTDPLTQIPNRLYFEQRLADEWSRSFRESESIAFMLIDIDHFKSINDTYGHPFGDQCLVSVAAVLRSNLYRDVDILARYGGEEFVVALPGIGPADALLVAERLRTAVADLKLEAEGKPVPLTCSVGVATVSPRFAPGHVAAAIDQADRALYAAKGAGRNRVQMAEDPPVATRVVSACAKD
ncbi:GGDEF domain-containing protein [Pseudomonas sp. Marseille-Q8238]